MQSRSSTMHKLMYDWCGKLVKADDHVAAAVIDKTVAASAQLSDNWFKEMVGCAAFAKGRLANSFSRALLQKIAATSNARFASILSYTGWLVRDQPQSTKTSWRAAVAKRSRRLSKRSVLKLHTQLWMWEVKRYPQTQLNRALQTANTLPLHNNIVRHRSLHLLYGELSGRLSDGVSKAEILGSLMRAQATVAHPTEAFSKMLVALRRQVQTWQKFRFSM